jgi:hypothetical protein
VPDAVWWTFLVGVYVPVTMLVAWPLTHLLGLWPKQSSARPVPERRYEAERVLVPEFAEAPSQ